MNILIMKQKESLGKVKELENESFMKEAGTMIR